MGSDLYMHMRDVGNQRTIARDERELHVARRALKGILMYAEKMGYEEIHTACSAALAAMADIHKEPVI